MRDYRYTAKDSTNGKIVKGQIQADNDSTAAQMLMDKNLFPIKISTEADKSLLNMSFLNKVSLKDKVIFTRQLSTLIKAGLPITQALSTAVEQVASKPLRAALSQVVAAVEGGSSLADAFAEHPEIFNHVYVSLVAAGETSGTLDKAMERLADELEKENAIISKVRGAMIYPAIVLVVIILVIIFMLISILPQVKSLYDSLGKSIPFLTAFLLGVANFVTGYWWLTILILIALFAGLRSYFHTPAGRRLKDRTKMRFPVIGMLFKKVYMARFSRTMASLVNSGVPILEALEIVAEAVNNVIIREIVLHGAENVKGGKSLSSILANNEYFLPLVPQMIRIGEDSGTLGDMLDKTASFYEDEVDQQVKNLSTIIEPVMIVVLGGMVMFIIGAVLFPIYGLVGGGLDNIGSSNSSTQSK